LCLVTGIVSSFGYAPCTDSNSCKCLWTGTCKGSINYMNGVIQEICCPLGECDCSGLMDCSCSTPQTCAPPDPCVGIQCGTHGHCSMGACLCDNGWSGPSCQDDTLCDHVSCGSYGTCSEGNCACFDGYAGPSCQTPPDPCSNVVCGLHGSCSDGLCSCLDGFSGSNCQIAPASSEWVGTWVVDDSCNTERCCCLSGSLVISSLGPSALHLSSPLAGPPVCPSSVDIDILGVNGNEWQGQIVDDNYDISLHNSIITCTDLTDSQCSGTASPEGSSDSFLLGLTRTNIIIVGSCLGVVVLFIILVIFLVLRHRKQKNISESSYHQIHDDNHQVQINS